MEPKTSETQEEMIKQFLATTYPDSKSYFCRFHKRGLCIFVNGECHFAHGPEDFVYKESIHQAPRKDGANKPKKGKQPDEESKTTNEDQKLPNGDQNIINEDSKKPNNSYKLDKEPITNSNNDAGDDDDEEDGANPIIIPKQQQRTLGLGISYDSLYKYQLSLQEKGVLDEFFTLQELNTERPKRVKIRNRMLKELGQAFCDVLYDRFQTNVLKRSDMDLFFYNMGWTLHQPSIIDNVYAFEVKQPGGNLVVKLPKQPKFSELIEDNIIYLIAQFKLHENLPISSSALSKHYYKDLLAAKPLEPTPYVLKQNTGLSFDEFLQELQKSATFKKKLAAAVGKDPAEFEGIIIFETLSNEWKQFCEKINDILKEYIEKAPLGLAKYSGLEKIIFEVCQEEIKKYNNNIAYIKKMIKNVALRHKVLILPLQSDTYLFALDKFKRALKEDIDKITKKVNCNCKEINPFMGSQYKFPPFRPYKPEPGDYLVPDNRYSPEELDKQIDFNKIVVVDDIEKLEQARLALKEAKTIGVDLEGNLDRDGMVELVQCSYGGKIFVFDIFLLRLEAQNPENQKATAVYQETLKFLQFMMESPDYCKIFHDGRKDSLGLHSCLQSCLINTFDVSACYSVLDQLEVYLKSHKLLGFEELKQSQPIKNNEQLTDEKCLEIFKDIEVASRPPGLNDVLEKYKAPHGLNNLKLIMKERFWTMSKGYFLQRPIDKEFLIYAAKDVEDLEEMRKSMSKKLEEFFKKIYGSVPFEMIMLFSSYISYLYTCEGCINLAKE